MVLKSKVLSMILAIAMIFSITANTAVAEGSSFENLLNSGKSILNNILGEVKSVFYDIGSHWAKDNIQTLINKGSISGYPDGTFKPDGTITRAEFTKIFLTSMGIDPGVNKNGHWAKNYIDTAIKNGLIKSGEFDNVDQKISRIEVTKMVVRALNKEDAAQKLAGQVTKFKDDNSIANGNKGYVKIASAYGIVNGSTDGSFKPNAFATRAEASKMIVTYLNNMNNKLDLAALDDTVVVNGQPVKTSFTQMLPHIKRGMEIMKESGYATLDNYPKNNTVYFSLYKNREDSLGDEWIEKPILLSYFFYTEIDPRLNLKRQSFYAYNINFYDSSNEMARDKFENIISNIFPEGKNEVMRELNNKVKDISYNKLIITKMHGKDVFIESVEGSKQLNFSLGL